MQSVLRLNRLSGPLAAAAIVASLFGGRSPAFADGSAIGFSPAALPANPGDSFNIDVVVNLSQEIRGAQFGIKFDPSVVQVSSVSEGTFLKDWARAHHGQSAAAIPFQVDNNRGEVSIGGIILLGGDSNGGPSGNGVLATVKGTVKPDAAASAALTLTAVKFASATPNAAAVPDVTVTAGGISVGNAPLPNADPAGGTLQMPPQLGETTTPANVIVPSPGDAGPAPDMAPAPDIAPPEDAPEGGLGPPIWHDVFLQAEPGELPPIVVPTNAPVFSSDMDANRQATAVAAAATATALSKAIVPVTPPALQQPQSPALVTNPTPRPSPLVGASGGSSAGVTFAPTIVVPRTINQGLRPAGSAGIFIPWELIAGIGGGIIAAGLVLFGFRRAAPRPPA